MEYDYKSYVIRTFMREAQVYKLGQFECLARFTSLDAAMCWIDNAAREAAYLEANERYPLPVSGNIE